ncbi:MAG TPA: quinone oxidoreductase [Dehalococcoidia bacterium]|nr:quinone oxidoreductase [Dehalococcoidia bacterium]
MKAVRIHTYGGPEMLTYEDVEDPRPGAGEVLVRMKVIGVNYSDTSYRKGRGPRAAQPLPMTPGHEGFGHVAELGEGVSGVRVGDAVVFSGMHRLGTYKELMAMPALELIPVPPAMDGKLAVAVLNQGQTAHYLTHDAHPIEPGERVLIHAGAGGVGSNLVQIAKRMGASVFATVSTEDKAAFVRELGADEVCIYTQVDFEAEVKRWTGGDGVEAVFDAIGGEVLPKSLNCLARKGHAVCYGQSAGPPTPPIAWPQRQLSSYYMSNHHGNDYNHPGEEAIGRAHEVFRWVREGELKVHIHKEYALSDAAQAHRDIESRGTIGKLLLIP